jgi:hypothetical protein
MAKTDSFFIRKAITLDNNGDFNQVAIDLGAYVDALGKAVLRIHNIAVQYSDPDGRTPDVTKVTPASCDFQITTQSQTDMVISGNNKSVVASGRLIAYTTDETAASSVPSYASTELDLAPQHWTRGYLIGVEQMYISGVTTTTGWAEDVVVSIIMECQSETLSKEAAMALALSQQ